MSALYKFIADPNVIPFLLKGILKFTPIVELNDPSELVPRVSRDEIHASLVRLRRDGYSQQDMLHLQRQGSLLRLLAPRFQAVDVPKTRIQATALIRSAFYDSLPLLEQLLDDTAREISSKVGLFCLSQRYDSLPMWAHYAANAEGLALEFTDLKEVFQGDDTGVLRQPIPVRYEREQWGVTFDPQSHEALFFAKGQDWSYEQEVRVVLPLADCRQQIVGERVLYFHDVPAHHLVRVILGWRMPPAKVEFVRAQVGSINPRVEVLQARYTRDRIEVSKLVPPPRP